MKFNLKNRPKIHPLPLEQQENLDEYDIGDYPHFYDDSLEWFDGFEKELREDADRLKKSREEADYHTTMVINSLLRWIMEILGETNSEG